MSRSIRVFALPAAVAVAVVAVLPLPSAVAAPPPAGVKAPSTFIDVRQIAGQLPDPTTGNPKTPAWTADTFKSEFGYLKQTGITEVILNGAVSGNGAGAPMTTYYASSISCPGSSPRPCTAQATDVSGNAVDAVTPLLAAARASGIKVWLGTYLPDDRWTKGAGQKSTLDDNKAVTQAVMGDLNAKYTAYHDVISGWYLSSEVSAAWPWTWGSGAMLGGYYMDLVASARAMSLTQKTMVAPYCTIEALPPAKTGQTQGTWWQDMWTQVLAVAQLDVIALQDGTGDGVTGADGNPVWRTPAVDAQQLAVKYSATREAIRAVAARTELWADLDYYDVFGNMKPIREVNTVVTTVAPYVDKFTGWSFSGQYSYTKLGTYTYFTPFARWNNTGVLPAGDPTAPTNLTVVPAADGRTTVSWQPSSPAPGNFLAFYRVFAPDGVTVLADVFPDQKKQPPLQYTTSKSCLVVRALDTVGNTSSPASTCPVKGLPDK